MKLFGAVIFATAIALGSLGGWGLFNPEGREMFVGFFNELGAIVPAAMIFAAPFLTLVGLAMMFCAPRAETAVRDETLA